jgi:hypothetical protein
MNTRNWNRAVRNMNKYNLSKNQRNIVTLANALVKTGKPPGGGDRHRLHPNTFRRFMERELMGQNLVNQMKRNSNARGGYRGRALAKAAIIGGAVALGGYAAAPYIKQTILKARNFKRNNGRITNNEVQRLAKGWENKGFEIKNMNQFARHVRSSANSITANQAAAQFNKAFRNGTISMVVGGLASSTGAAAMGGASRVAAARNAFARAGRLAARTGAPNRVLLNQAARAVAKNQGMSFGQGVSALRRMTNTTRAGINRARMMRK